MKNTRICVMEMINFCRIRSIMFRKGKIRVMGIVKMIGI